MVTSVIIQLQCKRRPRFGKVDVTGEVNRCVGSTPRTLRCRYRPRIHTLRPVIDDLTATPIETGGGGTT
jgi:hypothetical protein